MTVQIRRARQIWTELPGLDFKSARLADSYIQIRHCVGFESKAALDLLLAALPAGDPEGVPEPKPREPSREQVLNPQCLCG
jgi:hypothetical protein